MLAEINTELRALYSDRRSQGKELFHNVSARYHELFKQNGMTPDLAASIFLLFSKQARYSIDIMHLTKALVTDSTCFERQAHLPADIYSGFVKAYYLTTDAHNAILRATSAAETLSLESSFFKFSPETISKLFHLLHKTQIAGSRLLQCSSFTLILHDKVPL